MRVILFLLVFCSKATAFTAVNPVILPHTLVITRHSQSNKVLYNIYISLPKNYYSESRNYPIIYLLDADYSFALTKQISEHLSDRNRIKESIIIGIAYANHNEYKKNRTRDYTPSNTLTGGYGISYQKYSGGAEKFYQFIHLELFPYIKNHYKVNNNTTFVGHSFGGLFGVYLLTNHPDAFNHYIIVSPSLWYDNQLILKRVKNKPDFNLKQVTKAYFLIGEQENKGDYRMVDDLQSLNTYITKKSHINLETILSIINGMDHDTVFPTALTQGLMKIYN